MKIDRSVNELDDDLLCRTRRQNGNEKGAVLTIRGDEFQRRPAKTLPRHE